MKTRLPNLITAGLALFSPILPAAEWFVSLSGNDDTGNGSIAQPYRTVTHVLDPANAIVEAGDIVTLRSPANASVYNETEVRLRVPLTLRSQPGEFASIACPINVPDTVCVQIDPDASGSRISRLDISGGYYYAIFLQTGWESGGGQSGTGASDVIIEDSRIHGSGRDTIKITPKSNNVTIRRNEIYNSGAGYPPGTLLDDKNAEGIDNVNGSGMRVEDNYIHDTATTCVYFKGGAGNVVVERNRIENCGLAGILVGFDTSPEFFDTTINPGYYEALSGTVRNNLVRNTAYAGIGLYASKDSVIANNTIVNSANLGHAAIYFGVTLQDFEPEAARPPNLNPLIRNNLILQSGGDCVRIRWANELGGLSGLSGNPGTDYNAFFDGTGPCNFADGRPGSALASGGTLSQWQSSENADSHSFQTSLSVDASGHLPADSAAIDQAQTLPQVVDDIDRQARSAPYDIGADERASDLIFHSGFQTL